MWNKCTSCITCAIACVIACLTSCASNNQFEKTKELLKAYQSYYVGAEALLDSIYVDNPNRFDDVIAETDVYDDYIVSKQLLDSMISK